MKYILSFLFSFTTLFTALQAQTIEDARRFSQHGITGTARSIGMGGAFTAVGGDFASSTLNPAGLGLYRGGELNFTPAVQIFGTRSNFLGNEQVATTTNLSIGGLGLVLTFPTYKRSGLKSITLGLGLNQLQQHRRRIKVDGFNPASSITSSFAERANGILRGDLQSVQTNAIGANDLAGLAFTTGYVDASMPDTFDVYMIDNIRGDDARYFGAFGYGNIQQSVERFEKGRTNEWNVSMGFNLNENFFIGAALGITDLNWRMENTIRETDSRFNYEFNSVDTMSLGAIEFRERVTTTGTGVNFKLGVISQPTDFLRIGLSFETPSINWMTDRYSSSARLEGNNANAFSENETLENTYDYTLVTPYRLRLGLAGIIGKKGIISADFGLIDYSTTEFRSRAGNSGSFYTPLNKQIRREFQLGYEARVGAEYRMDEVYFRTGLAYWTETVSPSFSNSYDVLTGRTSNYNADRFTGSIGIGYRTEDYYIDIAYAHQIQTDTYTLYTLTEQPYNHRATRATIPVQALNRRTFANVAITLGLLFGPSGSE